MKHTSKKLTIISAILLSLAACDGDNSKTRDGAVDTKYFQKHVHKHYLDCYALDEDSKAACVDRLNEKYILKRFWDNPDYLVSFQYQAEKLGFKHFINDAGKPCDAINEGPIFDDQEQRYIVKCKGENIYYMRFNYETTQWQLEG